MANQFDYFPLFHHRLLLAMRGMSSEQKGAYVSLLLVGWDKTNPVGHFPSDDATLSDWADVDLSRWTEIKDKILRKFDFNEERNIYVQQRMVSTYAFLKKEQRIKKERASAGGKAKAEKEKQRSSEHAQAVLKQTQAVLENANKTKPNQTKLNQTKPNQSGCDQIREALAWAGVGGGWKKCAEIPGLTPIGIVLLAEEIKKTNGGAGLIVQKITNGYTPPKFIAAETLSRLSRQGRIASICGHEVRASAGGSNVAFSTNGVLVISDQGKETRLKAEEIHAGEIVVRLDKELG